MPTPSRIDRNGVTVKATHSYQRGRRQSTGWISVEKTKVPIDFGVTHGGMTVYLTLMNDVVAVPAGGVEASWRLKWNKRDPFWNTLSIVQLDEKHDNRLAVELYAADARSQELIYRYLDLKTGEPIQLPKRTAGTENQQHTGIASPFPFQIVERDRTVTKRVELRANPEGRSPNELLKRWALRPNFAISSADSITERATLVSAVKANWIANAMEAKEIIFNLPEGSGFRAEMAGDSVAMGTMLRPDNAVTVTVTNGKVQLIDQGGVVRAWASPDGGAEQLVIKIREEAGEYVMRLRAQRLQFDPEYPDPPVQCVVNPETGAPKDEVQPPHGAIRYQLQRQEDPQTFQFRILWRYDVRRVEAESDTNSQDNPQPPPESNSTVDRADRVSMGNPDVGRQDDPESAGWGALAEHSGLRSRLTLQTDQPKLGEPLLFKLEVRNFGDEPWQIDPQEYAPFRVLRVQNEDFTDAAPFIGATPQTEGVAFTLAPGQ